MDIYDLYDYPEIKNDYGICLNWTVSSFRNIYCFCEKHHVFVSEKQTKRRHCKKGCVHKLPLSEENKGDLIKRTEPLIKLKVQEFRAGLFV